ncbi:MAG: ABC transporter ATP-binding protein [Actinomycetota bacterium]|nr:ABC transporter ATP-binding protein [Actinomycetota bacterium]
MTIAPEKVRTGIAAHMEGGLKTYGTGGTEIRALDGIDVGFEKERFTAIMGPSGSGKSTLLHTLAGLDSLDGGSAYIGEVELGSLNDRKLTMLRRERLGFIFQAFNLIPTLSAEENITLPISIAGGTPDSEWFEEVVAILGLSDRLDHRPSELSGGEQQRVAAARALVSRPEIIFADEPSGNLDSKSGTELLDFMRTAVRELGQTIVMVTHDPMAASYADRVVFLADGKVVGQMDEPTTDSVIDHMKTLGA